MKQLQWLQTKAYKLLLLDFYNVYISAIAYQSYLAEPWLIREMTDPEKIIPDNIKHGPSPSLKQQKTELNFCSYFWRVRFFLCKSSESCIFSWHFQKLCYLSCGVVSFLSFFMDVQSETWCWQSYHDACKVLKNQKQTTKYLFLITLVKFFFVRPNLLLLFG